MKTILQAVAVFILPVTLYAATDCKIVELADHFEAICVGDERYAAEAAASSQLIKQNVKQQQAAGAAKVVRPAQQGGGVANLVGSEPLQSPPAAVKKQQHTAGAAEMVLPTQQGRGVSSMAGSEPPQTQSAAVKKLVDYRLHRLQRSDVEAKKAVRNQMMQAGRQNEIAAPQPQNIDDM